MNCILCKANIKHTFEHPTLKTIFHQCETCGIIFKDSSYFPSFDIEKARYEEHNNDINQEGYVQFLTRFIDEGITPFQKKGTILDFGSGPNPVLAILLKRYGYDVSCYDPFFHENLDLNETYDMMTATEVVEHFHDPIKEFTWIDKHVKHKGYLSFMTLFYPEDRLKFLNWYYQRDVSHVVFYSPLTWRWLAKRFSWEIMYTDDYRIIVYQKK